jgi:N-terminal acetyltransferase B complex catalytic subunit
VVGKAEGTQHDWHGHVTAISVAPEYRRLGLAQNMMDLLERVSDNYHRGFFVDLFVKTNNKVAIPMYERMGYSVWRRIRGYYQGKNGDPDEDAYGTCHLYDPFSSADLHLRTFDRLSSFVDMRKSLSRDPGGRFVRANGRDMIFSPDGITM